MGLFNGAFKGAKLGKTLGTIGSAAAGGLLGGGPGMMAGGLLGSQLFKLLRHGEGKPGMGMYGENLDLGAGSPDFVQGNAPPPTTFSDIMEQLSQIKAQRAQQFGGGYNPYDMMSFRR